MQRKLVSIIVPVYNAEKTIERSVESLLKQTYSELEIILVNDGSTDGSEAIIKRYLSDNRVKLINKPNGGASSARNVGLAKATGEYIQFTDIDDYIEDNMIFRLVETIEKKNASLVICGYKSIDGSMLVVPDNLECWCGKEISTGFLKLWSKQLINTP